MLANGITLSVKVEGAETYEILKGLKEVPELGADPEKVDNTCLEDEMKIYELGIGDAGDLAYKFKWENGDTTSYRKLRTIADSRKKASFEQTFPDGTKFRFDAQCGVKVGGGGVNSAIDFTLNLALQSKLEIVDPENDGE